MSFNTAGSIIAEMFESFSDSASRFSFSSIGMRFITKMSPWSSSSSSFMNPMPVSVSPLSRASCIGDAPLYFGRSEG